VVFGLRVVIGIVEESPVSGEGVQDSEADGVVSDANGFSCEADMGATMATSQVKGADSGASCMRCTNRIDDVARIPCTRHETSQPRRVCRVRIGVPKCGSMVTAG